MIMPTAARMTDRTDTANLQDPNRLVWVDFARGIGIILVVLGHVLGGLYNSGLFPHETLLRWIVYTLYTFHMPMFFFLAGLNAQHSLRRGASSFLVGKVTTIAYPYVLWSLIQGSIVMVMAGDTNIPITAADLAAIWYRPIGQFWFLYALMLCHIVACIVNREAVMVGLAIAGFAIFSWLHDPPDLALTLHHFAFYVIGRYASPAVISAPVPRLSGWLIWPGLVVAFAIAIAIDGSQFGLHANGVTALPASIFGIAAVILLSKLLNPRWHRWLATIGTTSMTIYILHILAGSGIRIVMLKLHVPPWPWLYLLVGTVAGVVLPMLAHLMLPRLGLLKVLGLAPPKTTETRAAPALAPSGAK
jgi:fucose 4-O-acetylase-like acetyltransferase